MTLPRCHVLSSKRVGAHVSMAKGVSNAIVNSLDIGGTAFALFTGSPRTWKINSIPSEEISKWNKLIQRKVYDDDNGLEFSYTAEYILPHGCYLVNLGHSEEEGRTKSLDYFKQELNICNSLGIKMLNIHPGSTRRKISREKCIELIADSINKAFSEIPEVKVVLENTAGGGGTIGNSFEELNDVIQLIKDKNRVGVCLDTCHLFASGYDISTSKKFDNVLKDFDSIVGLKYLSGMHLNDSKVECGSKLDRHEKIGEGKIGLECFKFIMNDDRFNNIPMILETPGDSHKQEIELLYSLEKSRGGSDKEKVMEHLVDKILK